MDTNKKLYLKLLTSSFTLSAFTFGGGYVIISMMKRKFTDQLHWLEENEMLDLAAIAQSSPGAVAVNAAVLLGWRLGGFPGALVCLIGTILPPLILLSVISVFYTAFRENVVIAALLRGMQAGVAAVIADVVIDMGSGLFRRRQWDSVLLMAAAFIATVWFHVNVMYLILGCIGIGILRIGWNSRRKKEDAA